MSVTIPEEGRKQMELAIQGWHTLALRLFKNSPTLGDATVFADFTEANFSGYSASATSWGSQTIDGSGNAVNSATAITFSHNGGPTSNTVQGWYLIDGSSSKIIAAEYLASPKSMA